MESASFCFRYRGYSSACSQPDLWTLFAISRRERPAGHILGCRNCYQRRDGYVLIWKHHSRLIRLPSPRPADSLACMQMYSTTAGGWWKEQQSCTHPSLCNVICRTAFVRRSTARTGARLTCVRCVHSQGRQRRHKCSGTWWSQNCPWSGIENKHVRVLLWGNNDSTRVGVGALSVMTIVLFICKRQSIKVRLSGSTGLNADESGDALRLQKLCICHWPLL